MKKLLKVILTVFAACLLLVGCGGNGEEKPVTTQSGQSESTNTSATDASREPEVSIEEAVLYDGEEVTITVNGMESGWMGQDIQLLVENKTDKNIALSGDNMVVNGVTMGGYLYIDVAAGKKANGTLTLYSDGLATAGIDQIAWIQTCDARIVDTDSFETLGEANFEIVTSLGRDFVQPVDESGELLFEANGIQVLTKVMTDEFYGKTLVLYVKNGSGKDVTVQAENVSVNGFTLDAWMYDFVSAGTVRYCDLDLWESGLEENGIEEIQDVTFTIQLIDPYSYATLAESGELQVFIGE